MSGSISAVTRAVVPRWVVVCLGLLAAIFLSSLLVEAWVDARETTGVVLAEEVVARKGDSATYQPSFKEPLHVGAEFRLIEDRGDWVHIELADGRRCWVPKKNVGLVR